MKVERFKSRFAHLPSLLGPEIGRPRFRFRNPIMPGVGEPIVQPVYDWYSVAVGTAITRQVMFTIPQGQQYTGAGVAALAKTQFHTNMTQSGVLTAPNKLLVRAVACWLRNDIASADINRFLTDALTSFRVQDKEYYVSILGRIPAGGGAFLGGSTNVAASTNICAANGWPSPDAQNQLTDGDILGVQIEQQQGFQVIIDPTLTGLAAYVTAAAGGATLGTGINLFYFLDGILLRAVV
jgi:hypothetical protein